MSPEEQRKSALERANDIRIERANLKKKIKRGEVKIPDIILAPPECIYTMSLSNLLICQHGWASGRVLKFRSHTRLNTFKRIENMTLRERQVVKEWFTRTSGSTNAMHSQN